MGDYHDHEWGVPSHDDRHVFEMLTLEGAQAGLSWATILNRRGGYRRAFANFDPAQVARFTDRRLELLRQAPGINHPRTLADLPATTELSDRISKDLKRRNFTFVGSTIIYSLLQSVGIVDDHVTTCPFKQRVAGR